MTKPNETLERIPLSKLVVAPENARFGSENLGDLDALAGSIVAVGDLIDPLHAYGPDDHGLYSVWDGGRRLNALLKLVKGKKSKLPEALAAGVPVLVADSRREAATLLSAATFNREPMHPADDFLNYKRMFDAGMDPQAIAAACAVPAPRVRQLLRLNGVAPAILDAFRAGAMALDAVEAFTLSADPERQLACFEALSQRKSWSAHDVKRCLRQNAMGPRDRWAKFVGREAYEAAGGTFLSDLFSGSEEEDQEWADGALVMQLAEAKVQALIDEVKAEGWGEVVFVDHASNYGNWNRGKDQKREPEGGWTPEFKAGATAYIVQNYNGDMDVKRGWTKAGKASGSAGSTAEKPDQALYGYGHAGHFAMTTVATEATRVALLRNPEAAYDGLLTHLTWIELRRYGASSSASRLKLETEGQQAPVNVSGADELDAAREAWTARFKPFLGTSDWGDDADRVGFCDAVANLSPDEKANLLAFCFASTVWGVEPGHNARSPGRWAHLGWLARWAGADLQAAWTPDAGFLKGGSKEALIGAVKELNGKASEADKKAALVTFVGDRAPAKRWLPKLLRDLMEAPKPKAAAAPKAEPKKRKGAAGAVEAIASAMEAQDAAKGAGEGSYPPADPDADLPASLRALANGTAKPIPEPSDAD